jgi:hypothetical protein
MVRHNIHIGGRRLVCTSYGLQQKLMPILFALVIINIVLFTFLSLPNLYKTSFIEKTRFNIPYSWQKYHKKQSLNYKLPKIDNSLFLVNQDKLHVELYKYALYGACRTNEQSFTVYILTTVDNYEGRDKFRTKWIQNRPETYDSESLIFVMILEEKQDDDEIPDKLFLEHRMHDDLLVIWNEPGIVNKPEISAIISHASECETNMEDYSRHILITTDEYFWFSDSLENFLLADVQNLQGELAIMMGDINFGDEDNVLNGQVLPPKCGEGACVITKNAVQKLSEVSQEKFEGDKMIYFDDHMTYLSLLVHKINERFESAEDTQLKIQYYSDRRFWSWHESDVDKLTCLTFNFPIKIYGKYQDMCEE